ncbi:MAG TPA: HEAT repeat domain-containing protein [Pirellulales bacterium]|nr:HEAT repeat domain-containing protein [Pirellulales bacterium]
MISSKNSATPPFVRHFVSLGLLILAVTALGCGHAAPSKAKPTADEMKQMQAMVETPPVNPLAPLSERAENAYRPWGIKETAVDALGRIGTQAVPTLVKTLDDPNPRVRAEAARALARIGPEATEAVPALMARLDDPDEDVRQASARALGQVGPAAAPAVPALISLIDAASNKSSIANPPAPNTHR